MSYLNQIIDKASKKERIQKMTRDEAVLSVIQSDPQLYKKYVTECRKSAIDRQPGTGSPYMDKINTAVRQQVAETGQTENEALLAYLATPVGADLYRQHVEFLRKDPRDQTEAEIDWQEQNRNQH